MPRGVKSLLQKIKSLLSFQRSKSFIHEIHSCLALYETQRVLREPKIFATCSQFVILKKNFLISSGTNKMTPVALAVVFGPNIFRYVFLSMYFIVGTPITCQKGSVAVLLSSSMEGRHYGYTTESRECMKTIVSCLCHSYGRTVTSVFAQM